MTTANIPPCPVCGKLLIPSNYNGTPCLVGTESCSGCGGYHSLMPEVSKHSFDGVLGRACRELGIGTVEQLRELVGIACDACDERTVRATNRAENLVPLLRRRAALTLDLVSLPKDSQETISEKLSQSAAEQAPEPTVKASLIAKRGEVGQ